MRVVLVRHGPSAHRQHSRWIDRDEVLRWRQAYDDAGIRMDSQPPPQLLRAAADVTHIMASDLPRAVDSALRVAGTRALRISPLFRETHIDVPRWPTRLPLAGWEVVIHAAWNYRILLGTDATPAHRAQAAQAAGWLSDLSGNGSTALVVTHGVFRRLLSRQLVSLGWTSVGRAGGFDHWSAWTLERRSTPGS